MRSPQDRPQMSWIYDHLIRIGSRENEMTTNNEQRRGELFISTTTTMPTPSRNRIRFPSSPVIKRHIFEHNDTVGRIPRTPSPVYSDSDESSSEGGPSTPPSNAFAHLSMTPRRSTKPTSSLSAIHPFLEIDSYSRAAPLCWDVRLPTSTATIRPTPDRHKPKRSPLPNHPLEATDLFLPATYPPTTRMVVAIPQLYFLKPMVIKSTPECDDRYVSVLDLLSALHDSLQTRVWPDEWAMPPRKTWDAFASTFDTHYKLTLKGRLDKKLESSKGENEWESEWEVLQYLSRVDCLGGATEFSGLSLVRESGSEVWKLTLARPSISSFFSYSPCS